MPTGSGGCNPHRVEIAAVDHIAGISRGSHMAEVRATIPGLQDLSRSIQKNNDDLRRLTADVERTVGSTIWTGQAAEKFKESWSQQKKNLQSMSDMLDQVKKEVEERTRRLEHFEA